MHYEINKIFVRHKKYYVENFVENLNCIFLKTFIKNHIFVRLQQQVVFSNIKAKGL